MRCNAMATLIPMQAACQWSRRRQAQPGMLGLPAGALAVPGSGDGIRSGYLTLP